MVAVSQNEPGEPGLEPCEPRARSSRCQRARSQKKGGAAIEFRISGLAQGSPRLALAYAVLEVTFSCGILSNGSLRWQSVASRASLEFVRPLSGATNITCRGFTRKDASIWETQSELPDDLQCVG